MKAQDIMADELLVIKRALVSVSDKAGLAELAKALDPYQVELLSTGGTAKLLKQHSSSVVDVAEYTGSPEILDGRVKTLHPKIHGGLLGCLDDQKHQQQMQEQGIESIDLVVVNLYPFEETVAAGGSYAEIIEKIDIGGPSMVRSAAKNYRFTVILTDPADYALFAEELAQHNGAVSLAFREQMAAKAFARTAAYDSHIAHWFAVQQGDALPQDLLIHARRAQSLRYGENPHQKAAFYAVEPRQGLAAAEQIHGKELSYNNIHDADAALALVAEFEEPACVIIKHANPCGVGVGDDMVTAYQRALSSDPVSAFGGIIAINREADADFAEQLSSLFLEALIVPAITEGAKALLQKKKNLRILVLPELSDVHASVVKSVSGGFLVQDADRGFAAKEDIKVVTKRVPTQEEMHDLLFAERICKHVKSNAIVLVKDGGTIGMGAGQTSRVDSTIIAGLKAAQSESDAERAKGSVLASDAFFPFADGVLEAAKIGVKAIIQPGGSIRDEEVIAAANQHGIAMVFTGMRHFRH